MENEIIEDSEILGVQTSVVSPFKTALKWGVIGGIIFVIIGLFKFIFSDNYMDSNWMDQAIQYIIIILIIVAVQLDHRKNDLGGRISYGRSLGTGVLAIVFASIILAIYTFISMNYMIPETTLEMAIQKAIDQGHQGVIDSGQELTDEMAEGQEKWIRFMFKPETMIFLVILGMAFMGTIFSLITSIFIKRN